MSAAVFDPLDLQEDGIVTAKLRVKEDSDCGPFGAAPLCRQRFEEGFQGEDELERAFQVESPQAIVAACQVELAADRMSAGPPASQ